MSECGYTHIHTHTHTQLHTPTHIHLMPTLSNFLFNASISIGFFSGDGVLGILLPVVVGVTRVWVTTVGVVVGVAMAFCLGFCLGVEFLVFFLNVVINCCQSKPLPGHLFGNESLNNRHVQTKASTGSTLLMMYRIVRYSADVLVVVLTV